MHVQAHSDVDVAAGATGRASISVAEQAIGKYFEGTFPVLDQCLLNTFSVVQLSGR